MSSAGPRLTELLAAVGMVACRPEVPCGPVSPAPPVSSFDGSTAGEARTVEELLLVWVPAGTFTMGSPRGEPERRPGEDQVPVTLTQGFWMAAFETTQGAWKRVVGPLPAPPTADLPESDDLPVGT